ncbi:hypothetical protein PR202_ga09993 [Eleusine coracana subsp. coracana]|uniref:Uncharacterized protein n=1 Tax=Eleusine coracana subsp. coracana TaxID=191504 RepID=A0AAV5C525_ELECO|nr:hypothetical protein PR202_ga09993 [Eleusine coracana subsp. coracana]
MHHVQPQRRQLFVVFSMEVEERRRWRRLRRRSDVEEDGRWRRRNTNPKRWWCGARGSNTAVRHRLIFIEGRMQLAIAGQVIRDSRWQSMRNVIISIYQPSHVASLIPAIQPYVERAGQLLHPGEEITFSDLSLKLFSDTIGQVAFGVDFGLTKNPAASSQKTTSSEGVDAATDFIRKHSTSTTPRRP